MCSTARARSSWILLARPRWPPVAPTCWRVACPGWWRRKTARSWALPMPTGSSRARPTVSRPRTRCMWAEDSVYVADSARGRGLGRQLLAELVAQAQAAGVRKLLAVIGDSANAGSIGLHRALGFTDVGTMRSVGWKFGAWRDIVLMEKSLGAGDSTAPEGDGAAPG